MTSQNTNQVHPVVFAAAPRLDGEDQRRKRRRFSFTSTDSLSSAERIQNFHQRRKPKYKGRKRYLINKILSKDYPGLDYLGFHDVLNAKRTWYRILWFTIVTICFLIGLYTIYRIIREYLENPSATLISVKSVEKLLLPQLTVCANHAGTINLQRMEQALFLGKVGNYTFDDVENFAYFMLAGSGFQKMNWKKFNDETNTKLFNYYNQFRGEHSIDDFFNYFMNNFGLQCHEFFYDCRLGDEILDCCKTFLPEYLMRRGRCFRSVKLFQRSFDELGKLRISLREPFEMDSKFPANQEVLAFLAEHKLQIAPFPRYYLYPRTWTKARITAKHISLFPANEVCSEENFAVSKDTCYIEKWLRKSLEEPHNCTYPYMNTIRKTSLKSCHPSLILSNYNRTVEAPSYTTHSCILACERWEYTVAIERTLVDYIFQEPVQLPYTYRIDVSYNDLQYEEIREVSTVTLAGLIAQIGGQLSLFLGSSILNLTQVLIMIAIISHRILRQQNPQPNAFAANSTNQQKNCNPAFNQHDDSHLETNIIEKIVQRPFNNCQKNKFKKSSVPQISSTNLQITSLNQFNSQPTPTNFTIKQSSSSLASLSPPTPPPHSHCNAGEGNINTSQMNDNRRQFFKYSPTSPSSNNTKSINV